MYDTRQPCAVVGGGRQKNRHERHRLPVHPLLGLVEELGHLTEIAVVGGRKRGHIISALRIAPGDAGTGG